MAETKPGEQNAIRSGNPANTIDLVKLFSFLLSKFWIIFLWVIIGAIGAFYFTKEFVTPMFEATSKIYIIATSKDSVVDLSDLQIGTNLTSDYIELMYNRPMLEEAIEDLKLDMEPNDLAKLIRVTNPANTRQLNITVASPDPNQAMKISNDIAAQAIKYLPKIMSSQEPNLIEEAIKPVRPVSPSYIKNTMLGALAGMSITVALYVIKFLNKDVFENEEDVMRSFGSMPLTTVEENSETKASKRSRRKRSQSSHRSPFRRSFMTKA